MKIVKFLNGPEKPMQTRSNIKVNVVALFPIFVEFVAMGASKSTARKPIVESFKKITWKTDVVKNVLITGRRPQRCRRPQRLYEECFLTW